MTASLPSRRALVAAGLAGLLLAACKPADPAGSGGAAGPGKIRIGEYASLTGKEAAFGQSSHKGTLLAIEEINQAGGVLGRQVELLTEDNRSQAGESVTIVKKF
ncbi:MAG: ABC transporter substrate-binding protein, partial [Verrucomicrobiota bacterium]